MEVSINRRPQNRSQYARILITRTSKIGPNVWKQPYGPTINDVGCNLCGRNPPALLLTGPEPLRTGRRTQILHGIRALLPGVHIRAPDFWNLPHEQAAPGEHLHPPSIDVKNNSLSKLSGPRLGCAPAAGWPSNACNYAKQGQQISASITLSKRQHVLQKS